MHLGLRAFARARRVNPDLRLTLVGQGPAEDRWRRLADRLDVGDTTRWIPWVEREALAKLYAEHDVLLFPSLHDPGGLVVFEAMAHGLPVVCLDLGGPGMVVDWSCGRVVRTADESRDRVVQHLADGLTEITSDGDLYARLRAGADAKCREFEWRRVVRSIYGGTES